MSTRRNIVVALLSIQGFLCVLLSVREFHHWRATSHEVAQVRSLYSYYVCSPAYQQDMSAKKRARADEVVNTQGDFIEQMHAAWATSEKQRRNGVFIMMALALLTVVEVCLALRVPRFSRNLMSGKDAQQESGHVGIT